MMKEMILLPMNEISGIARERENYGMEESGISSRVLPSLPSCDLGSGSRQASVRE